MNSSDGQLVTNPSVEEPNPQTPGTTPISASPRRCLTGLAVVSALVLLCFAQPLYSLVRFAAQDDMYSYILLVPFVGVYLIWFNRHNLSWDPQPTLGAALFPLLAGLGVLGGYYLAVSSGWHFQLEDYLCVMMLSLVFLLQACALAFAGWRMVRRVTFPIAFLFFLAPLPAVMFHSIETLLQNGSADVAYWLLSLSGMPVLRQGIFFQLPAFSLEVAPECSGIHSTFVLFITSLLAGYIFLRSPWRRIALALAVIPLALLRNGFRVFVIAQLCVKVSPEMIHSYIHRKGGPIFFALFLIPFFLVLWVLRKWDLKSYPASADQPIPSSKQS